MPDKWDQYATDDSATATAERWEKYATTSEPGEDPENPINQQHPALSRWDRSRAIGFASRYGPERVLSTLSDMGWDARYLPDGRYAVRKDPRYHGTMPGWEKWHVVDPSGMDPGDVGDIGVDLIGGQIGGAGAALGSLLGPGGAVAGGSVGGGISEQLIAPLARAAGVEPTPAEEERTQLVGEVAGGIAEGVGQAIPPVARAVGRGARNLLGRLRGGGAATPKPQVPAPRPAGITPPPTSVPEPVPEARMVPPPAPAPRRTAEDISRELIERGAFPEAPRAEPIPSPRGPAPLSSSPQALAARAGAEKLRALTPDLPPGKPEEVSRILDEALAAGEEITVSFVRRGKAKGMAKPAGEIRRMRIGPPPPAKTLEELAAEMGPERDEALLQELLKRQASYVSGKGMAYKASEKGLRTVFDLDAAAAGKGTAWRSLPMDSVVEIERAGKPIRFGPAGATEFAPERILLENQLSAAARKGEAPIAETIPEPQRAHVGAPAVRGKPPIADPISPGGVTPEDAGKRLDLPEPEGPLAPTGRGEPARTWSGAHPAVAGRAVRPSGEMAPEEILARLTAREEGRAPRSMDPFASRAQPEFRPYREPLTHRAGRALERTGEAVERTGAILNPLSELLEGARDVRSMDKDALLRQLVRRIGSTGTALGTGGVSAGLGMAGQVSGKLLSRAGRVLMRDNGRWATVLARGAAGVPPAVQSYAARALKALEQGRPERFRSFMYAITTLPKFREWLSGPGAGLFGDDLKAVGE